MDKKEILTVEVPKELDDKINKVAKIQTISRSALTRLAVKQYCDDALVSQT